MIRRRLRWSSYDHGVTMDPDYEIVPVADLPAAPATPVVGVVETRMDVTALHRALDLTRVSKDLTWREVARQSGVCASTMSRMAQGKNPDVNAFARLVRWLNVPAEAFFVEDGRPVTAPTGELELVAELAPLLRARGDLEERDVQLLEDLISAAVRRFRAPEHTDQSR